MDDVIHAVGADRVIFGSDWPHIEALPQPLDYVAEVAHLPAAEQKLILSDNVAASTSSSPPSSRGPTVLAPRFAVLANAGTRNLNLQAALAVLVPRSAAPATVGTRRDRAGSEGGDALVGRRRGPAEEGPVAVAVEVTTPPMGRRLVGP
ncbi:MAG: amidohydrolase family protein [Acidimicrobiales bacterium]